MRVWFTTASVVVRGGAGAVRSVMRKKTGHVNLHVHEGLTIALPTIAWRSVRFHRGSRLVCTCAVGCGAMGCGVVCVCGTRVV